MHRGAQYGQGIGPVFMELSGRQCSGRESELLECEHRPLALPSTDCVDHTRDASVTCSGIVISNTFCSFRAYCLGS